MEIRPVKQQKSPRYAAALAVLTASAGLLSGCQRAGEAEDVGAVPNPLIDDVELAGDEVVDTPPDMTETTAAMTTTTVTATTETTTETVLMGTVRTEPILRIEGTTDPSVITEGEAKPEDIEMYVPEPPFALPEEVQERCRAGFSRAEIALEDAPEHMCFDGNCFYTFMIDNVKHVEVGFLDGNAEDLAARAACAGWDVKQYSWGVRVIADGSTRKTLMIDLNGAELTEDAFEQIAREGTA
jgi:hypothetical protein